MIISLKKVSVVLLSIAMVIAMSDITFAASYNSKTAAKEAVDVLDNDTYVGGLNTEVRETSDSIISQDEESGLLIKAPKSGDDSIDIDNNESDESMSFSLPSQVDGTTASVSSDGTVTYVSNEEHSSVSIQMPEGGVRAMITIDDAYASREYSFKYSLPAGYKMVTSEEYYDSLSSEEKESFTKEDKSIYVINEENMVSMVIDPAWAKDANGDSVNTYFKLDGNTLTQVVEFKSNSAFPIIADPNNHPNIKKVAYLTKSQVRKMIDQSSSGWKEYASSTTGTFVRYAVKKIGGKVISGWLGYGVFAQSLTLA